MGENISKICDIWNKFIINSEYLQKKIGIKENIDLNYFGDLIKYLDDTTVILKIDEVLY